jgi:predicted transcriptional regulator
MVGVDKSIMVRLEMLRIVNLRGKASIRDFTRSLYPYPQSIKIINLWEKGGLITRSRDGRKKILTLTPKGKLFLEKLEALKDYIQYFKL